MRLPPDETRTCLGRSHRRILDLLNDDEMEGVLAHELGHVRNRDILISSIAATFAGAVTILARMAGWAAMFGGGGRDRDRDGGGGVFAALAMMILAPIAAMLIQMAVSRSREYQADATGAHFTGNPGRWPARCERWKATRRGFRCRPRRQRRICTLLRRCWAASASATCSPPIRPLPSALRGSPECVRLATEVASCRAARRILGYCLRLRFCLQATDTINFNVASTGSTLQRAAELERALRSIIRGKDDVVRLALVAILARGHLLIEGVPGVGKTTLAHALARAIDCDFRRVQFTSDMLPSDVLGISVYSTVEERFEFKRGPIFTNILLADEINRTTPKTQSALLEAMNERQVTVDGHPHPLPNPFLVIATQNPVEHHGTYPLPESQLDRFLIRARMGYPRAGQRARDLAGQRWRGAPG